MAFVYLSSGLSGSEVDISRRIEVFGSNVIPPNPQKGFLRLVREALQDPTLIILIVAAVFSLGLSFYKAPQSHLDGGGENHRSLLRSIESDGSVAKSTKQRFS